MDLWIRNQDRYELRKVNGVVMAQEDKFFAIYPVVKELGEHEILGHYKSEERALEVLDEIQRIIVYGLIDTQSARANGSISLTNPNCIVYEMPKE